MTPEQIRSFTSYWIKILPTYSFEELESLKKWRNKHTFLPHPIFDHTNTYNLFYKLYLERSKREGQ